MGTIDHIIIACMPGRHRLQDGMAGDLKKGRAVKYNRNVYQALTMITQFGINMLVPVFLCSFAGMFLDRKFGTSFWMILLFFCRCAGGIHECVPVRQEDL